MSNSNNTECIAIVGGGITGLFCAYILCKEGHSVYLFEATQRLGGRIRTLRLDKNNEPLSAADATPGKAWTSENLEFYAEFGPMRIEPDKQLLLKALLDHLVILAEPPNPPTDGIHLAAQTAHDQLRALLVHLGLKIESSNPPADDVQPAAKATHDQLTALLAHLGIKAGTSISSEENKSQAYLTDFPAYASPESVHDPKYELRPEEVGKTPLELLRMALLRVIAHVKVNDDKSPFSQKRDELISRITLAAATHESVDIIFSDWMKTLQEEHYWEIESMAYMTLKINKDGAAQKSGTPVPLFALGFWNLLSDYLSHDAITKLRDLGTFYHLLSENPNAAEWVVWWLRGFATTERLQGVCGGMECIIDELVRQQLNKFKEDDKLHWYTDCFVAELIKDENEPKLQLVISDSGVWEGDNADGKFDRVILALPKCALQKIAYKNNKPFESEPDIYALLDSAFAFAMLKLFVVVRNRWWQQENRANLYATRVPTRELHYWKGLTKDSRQGMIMLYTDRPNSTFWSNYVPPGNQNDVHRAKPGKSGSQTGDELPKILERRLTEKVVQYMNENDVPDITAEDIVWYGIRDWAREPYGGANHAWRPERKYWVVMSRLGDIPVAHKNGRAARGNSPSIHVCGEAYSDYHGFMEGSLRSAVYVLHRILDGELDEGRTLGWLSKSDLQVDQTYLRALQAWVKKLDDEYDCQGNGDRKKAFLYTGTEGTAHIGEQGSPKDVPDHKNG